MAIADELTKLEANRANIVAAINSKGGELAENAGLAACPEAISQLSSAGGTALWTGHVDEAGLRYIGWDDEDIANLKANICWNEEDDADYAVPQDHKDLWDACEKVVVNGRTMIDYSEIGKWINVDFVLRYLPMVDFRSVTYGGDYFILCRWMIGLPRIDTSNVRTFTRFWGGCYSLVCAIPIKPKANNIDALFQNCTSLVTIPQIDTSAATNVSYMFYGCSSLVTIPQLDTSAATNVSYMFYGCSSLVTIPQLDTSAATNMQQMFRGCSSLVTIPQLDTSAATNMQEMFCGCYKLRLKSLGIKYSNRSYNNIYGESAVVEITTDDMSGANDIGALHTNCIYLKKIKYNFTSSVISFNNLFTGTRNIEVMIFDGETSFAGVNSAYNNFTTSNGNSIPKTCVNYTMCTQLFNTMLRGVPAYSATSYPMYFESGSAVTDDAAGTLQSLVEQCQAMGWSIYNLTINPYTE